jgi:hypothetical protein
MLSNLMGFIWEIFFSKYLGYEIPEIGDQIKWYRVFNVNFGHRVSQYKKKKIRIRGFNDKVTSNEYTVKYIQINWFVWLHLVDMNFTDYEEMIKRNIDVDIYYVANMVERFYLNLVKKIRVMNKLKKLHNLYKINIF